MGNLMHKQILLWNKRERLPITPVIVTKMPMNMKFSFKLENLLPQTLMSRNGLALANYVGCVGFRVLGFRV
jgi:hypothetical protein